MSARRSRGQSPRPPRGGRPLRAEGGQLRPTSNGRSPSPKAMDSLPACTCPSTTARPPTPEVSTRRKKPTDRRVADRRSTVGLRRLREPAGSQLWPRRAYDHPALTAARHLSLKASPRRAQAQLSDEVLDTANDATGQRTSSASVLPDRSADRWSHAGRAWSSIVRGSRCPSVLELRHWSEFTEGVAICHRIRAQNVHRIREYALALGRTGRTHWNECPGQTAPAGRGRTLRSRPPRLQNLCKRHVGCAEATRRSRRSISSSSCCG